MFKNIFLVGTFHSSCFLFVFEDVKKNWRDFQEIFFFWTTDKALVIITQARCCFSNKILLKFKAGPKLCSDHQNVKYNPWTVYSPTFTHWTWACTLKGTGTNPTPQGYTCIVYHFSPVLWLLHHPDLALNQLSPHINTRLRLSEASVITRAVVWFVQLVQVVLLLPSYGSDPCLWMGPDSCRFRHHSGRPGLYILECHCSEITGDLRCNQYPHPAHLSAAGCMEPRGQEHCTW